MKKRPTPAAKAVITRDNELLLVKEELAEGEGWTLPGGRLRATESPEEALKREVAEEIGLSISVVDIIDSYSFFSKVESYIVAIVFLCRTENYNVVIDQNDSNEILDYNWFTTEEAAQLDLARGLQPVINRLDSEDNLFPFNKSGIKTPQAQSNQGKLVRDKIPAIIEESGRTPVTTEVNGEKYSYRLQEKLVEEVQEYLESGEPEELADILEVVRALSRDSGENFNKIRSLRKQKSAERGRFEQGIVLTEVLD
jgi:predicted house-cleaning noncanonical NTP pyrophosphatase (MazG superfamily)/ADP-ribose pyrophosphatase YjhB (NUDIX family)